MIVSAITLTALTGRGRSNATQSATVPNPDRLTGLDASFLALEKSGAHMHVGSVLVFEGEAPPYEDLLDQISARLHLVPRYQIGRAHV